MAGIMDFLEPLWSASYYTNKRTEDRAKEFKGLLGQYGQTDVQGPVQPGGILQAPTLPPQFYMQAAAIPGYEQYGLQGQQGQQAMERQQQGQSWQQNNMTASQAAQLEEQQRQWNNLSPYQQEQIRISQQNADTSAFGNYNMTPYQQAQVDISQQNANTSAAQAGNANVPKLPANYMPNPNGPGILPIPGSAPDVAQEEKVTSLEQGIAAAGEYIDFIKKYGAFESGPKAKEMQTRATNLLVNAQAAASNSGVLGQGEAATYAGRVPQINDIGGGLLQAEGTSLAQLNALKSQLTTQLEGIRKAQGKQGPSLFVPGSNGLPKDAQRVN